MFLFLLAGCPAPGLTGDTADEDGSALDATADVSTFDVDAACAASQPVLYGEVRDASGPCTTCRTEGLVLAGVAWNPCEGPVTLTYGCFLESVRFVDDDDGMDGVSDCDGPNDLRLEPSDRYEEQVDLASPMAPGSWTWTIQFGDSARTRVEGTVTVQ